MRGNALDDYRYVGGSGVVVLVVGVVPCCVGNELKRSAGYATSYEPVVILVVLVWQFVDDVLHGGSFFVCQRCWRGLKVGQSALLF